MSQTIWVAIITSVASILGGGAVVGYFKDRKKDNATAKLTDVEALQKQLVLLTQITDFLRTENRQLQADKTLSDERASKFQRQLYEVQEELDRVKKTARDTQEQCEELSDKLKEMMGEDKQ